MEKQKWDEKVAKAMKKKKQDAEYAAMSEDKGRHSWSAAHPAYMGASLCPDPRYRGGDTNGQGDSEAVHRCLRAGEGGESGYTEA
ncbi:MAG: hypothetical protein KHX30_11470 [Clostridium sp.]|nr:hypothetical protein [Clostridium sp.]